MKFTGTFVYMVHHFILLWLNPFGLRVDRDGWWFDPSVSVLRVCYCGEGALKTFPGLTYLCSEDGAV